MKTRRKQLDDSFDAATDHLLAPIDIEEIVALEEESTLIGDTYWTDEEIDDLYGDLANDLSDFAAVDDPGFDLDEDWAN